MDALLMFFVRHHSKHNNKTRKFLTSFWQITTKVTKRASVTGIVNSISCSKMYLYGTIWCQARSVWTVSLFNCQASYFTTNNYISALNYHLGNDTVKFTNTVTEPGIYNEQLHQLFILLFRMYTIQCGHLKPSRNLLECILVYCDFCGKELK